MCLKSAFVGYDESWFLSIDASIVDSHSTDPNTGNLSTYFERADGISVDGINLSRNNHCGQIPNSDAPRLKESVTQHVNEKAPTDIDFGSCHYNKNDVAVKKAEVTYSVENCTKDQSGRTRNGCEGLNEALESLPTVKVNHKSKKRKIRKNNEYEVVNHTNDDNDQSALQQVVGSCEQVREYANNEVSDLPMMDSKSNVDEPGQISSSNTRDESKHRRKRKYNLSEETEVDGKIDRFKNENQPMDNSFEVATQAGSAAKEMHKIEMMSGVINGVEGNRDLVSDLSKATPTPTPKVTSEYLSDTKQAAKVILGSLSTEPDVHLLETGSSGVKKKSTKKRKSKLSSCANQVVGLISTRVDQHDASRESDITTVPSPNIEEALVPTLLRTSTRERHNDSINKTADNLASTLVGESCMFFFEHYISIICMCMRLYVLINKCGCMLHERSCCFRFTIVQKMLGSDIDSYSSCRL